MCEPLSSFRQDTVPTAQLCRCRRPRTNCEFQLNYKVWRYFWGRKLVQIKKISRNLYEKHVRHAEVRVGRGERAIEKKKKCASLARGDHFCKLQLQELTPLLAAGGRKMKGGNFFDSFDFRESRGVVTGLLEGVEFSLQLGTWTGKEANFLTGFSLLVHPTCPTTYYRPTHCG